MAGERLADLLLMQAGEFVGCRYESMCHGYDLDGIAKKVRKSMEWSPMTSCAGASSSER